MSSRAASRDPAIQKSWLVEHERRVNRCSTKIQEIYRSLRASVEGLPDVTPMVIENGRGIDFERSERKFFTLHPKHSAKPPNIGVAFWFLKKDEVGGITGLRTRDIKSEKSRRTWIWVSEDSPIAGVVECAKRAYACTVRRDTPAARNSGHHPELEQERSRAEDEGAFDVSNESDARQKVLAAIVRRQGQFKFREGLLTAYQGRCAISGCALPCVLEAAHHYCPVK